MKQAEALRRPQLSTTTTNRLTKSFEINHGFCYVVLATFISLLVSLSLSVLPSHQPICQVFLVLSLE